MSEKHQKLAAVVLGELLNTRCVVTATLSFGRTEKPCIELLNLILKQSKTSQHPSTLDHWPVEQHDHRSHRSL